jgi:hypothetical protein
MRILTLEIRDRATFIPVLAIKLEAVNVGQRYLIRRAGFEVPNDNIILLRVDCGQANYDPYAWGDRTFFTAHKYIIDAFDALDDGDVVDVEFILGETTERKISERITAGDY